ncbi:MAG: hypothetical protein WC822_04965 [Candidatus Paceibacterota bacterium]
MTDQTDELVGSLACSYCDCPPEACDYMTSQDSEVCNRYLSKAKYVINSVLIPAGLVFVDEDQSYPISWAEVDNPCKYLKKVTPLRKVE